MQEGQRRLVAVVARGRPPTGRRDQRAQPVQHAEGFLVVGDGQAALQPLRQLGQWLGTTVQRAQQVHEDDVLPQPFAQRHPPLRGLEVPLDRRPQKELVLCAKVRLRRGVAASVHDLGQLLGGQQVAADQRVAQKGVDRLARFADDRFRVELLVEDARRVLPRVAAQRRRRAGAHQLLRRRAQPHSQATDQARQIRALGAVEGVELVHDQVPQRVGLVVAPEPPVSGPDHQVVQHLVVGEQDVRRAFAHRLAIRDHGVRSHPVAGRPHGLSDEKPGRHPAPQRRRVVDDPRDAPRLVRRQGVHGVDDDRLDARLARLPTTVLQHRVQEALGLTGTRPCCDHRGAPRVRRQPLHRRALVLVWRETQRDVRERLAALRSMLEGKRDRQVRPLGQVVRVGQKVVHDPGELGVGGSESGFEEVVEGDEGFGRDDGGDHGASCFIAALFSPASLASIVRPASLRA